MNKKRLLLTCVFGVAAIGLCVLGSDAQERAGYATLSGRPHTKAQAPVPNYAQRTVAAQKATFTAGKNMLPVRTASMPRPVPTPGCTDGGCAPMMPVTTHISGCAAPASVIGCGTGGCGEVGCATNTCAAPAAPCGNGCGCDVTVPFPAPGCGKMECGSAGSCKLGGGCGQSIGCTTPVPSGCGSMMTCPTEGCAPSMACAPQQGCGSSTGCAPAPMTMGYCGPTAENCGPSMGTQRYNRRMARYNDACYASGYNTRMNRILGKRNNCGPTAGSCNTKKESFWTRSSRSYQSRNAKLSQHLFGWLIPSGHGGQGSPPVGCYNTVYAQDANYFDQRDGEVYGAQGYGTHITTPLAPNVRHAYNYGWGLPSSRITRVSTVAPYTTLRPLSW